MNILLDSAPLGLISNPRMSADAVECRAWLDRISIHQVFIPEIIDYEVRRELLRAKKYAGLARLDELKEQLDYLPITTEVMLKAAEFWAQARNAGRQTADNKALDADVILAAQAWSLAGADPDTVIATTNPDHLDRFAAAQHWREIE